MKKKYTAIILLLSIPVLFSGCANRGYGVSAQAPGNPSLQATVQAPPPHGEPAPPPWAPAHGYRAKYRYRYYPDSSVYYDTGRGLYFYYGNGSWTASVSLPSSIRIDVGSGFVSLSMNTDRPYIYHGDVKKKYPPGKMKKENEKKGNKGKKNKHRDNHEERDRYEG
jgi:hypothetical protein